MKKIYLILILTLLLISNLSFGQEDELPPEMIEFLEALTPEQKEQVIGLFQGGVANGRWKEGLMMDGIAPGEDMFSAMQFYPGTEQVLEDEMRITFMGSSPAIREDQSGMSIYVELGNGENFIFDMGTGALKNYMSMGVPLMKMNNIFLTHLHADHIGDLPFLTAFRPAYGGYDTLRFWGPSGLTEDQGLKSSLAGLKQFIGWHEENFKIFPVGNGYDWEINEFDYADAGGIIYNENGVKIIHWPAIHVSDGASSYRLDWNGLSMVFTGDGRPSNLTVKYAKDCDIFISECYTEVLGLQAQALGVLPAIARWTYDNYHTSAYALGYMANKIKPRLVVATHWEYDSQQLNEVVAEVREHWRGPFAFGAPDRIVFNVRKDKIWWREGVTSPLAQQPRPQFTPLVEMPVPPNKVDDIQSQWIRDNEIPPSEYFPEGYAPELIKVWPLTEPIVVPMPESMQDPKYKKKKKE